MPERRDYTTKAGDKSYTEIKWGSGENWPSLDETKSSVPNKDFVYIKATITDKKTGESYSISSVNVPIDSIEVAWDDIADKIGDVVDRYGISDVQGAGFSVLAWSFTR